MTAVLFQQVSRHFGAVRAVDSVDLAIAEGEFFAMLGPSGSGKTTCLRLMAGFEQPTDGDIQLNGVSMTTLPPSMEADCRPSIVTSGSRAFRATWRSTMRRRESPRASAATVPRGYDKKATAHGGFLAWTSRECVRRTATPSGLWWPGWRAYRNPTCLL